MKIKKGDKLPDAKVFILEPDPKEVSIKKIVGNEKVILFGLPGAFTPTCSAKHLPGFIIAIDQLKKKGIKKVVCISVNDPFVMDAWGKTHNVQDKILMVGDSKGDFTKNDTFDISTLNTGTYIVKVEDNNNKTKTTKLVKL